MLLVSTFFDVLCLTIGTILCMLSGIVLTYKDLFRLPSQITLICIANDLK